MADVRHRNITEGEKHEPKNFGSGALYSQLIKDENSTSRYLKLQLLEPALNFLDGNGTAPLTPTTGDVYLLLDEGNGTVDASWDGASYNDLVRFNGVEWVATTPTEGNVIYDLTGKKYYIFSTSSWSVFVPEVPTLYTDNGSIPATTDRQVTIPSDSSVSFLGKVGVGVTPHASAILDLSVNHKGLLIPQGTTAQMNAITTPADNLLYFNTDAKALYRYDLALVEWVPLSAGYGIIEVVDSSGYPRYYADLQTAVTNSGTGGVVNIRSSYSQLTSVLVPEELTINGNGNTFTHISNSGSEFPMFYGVNGVQEVVYLNNIKIKSTGTGVANSKGIFGYPTNSNQTISKVICSNDTYLYSLNNTCARVLEIIGGQIESVNGTAVVGVSRNLNIITKYASGDFYNCEINVNDGGFIGSISSVFDCNVYGTATGAEDLIYLRNGRKVKNTNIYISSGSKNAIEIGSGASTVEYAVSNCNIYHLGTGRGVNAVYGKIRDSYIYTESGIPLYTQNSPIDDYAVLDVTCETNGTSSQAFYRFDNGLAHRIKGLTAICKNPLNTKEAIVISVTAANKLYLENSEAIVNNPSVANVKLGNNSITTGGAYIYNLLMSEIGTGLDLNTVPLLNSNTLDAYGNTGNGRVSPYPKMTTAERDALTLGASNEGYTVDDTDDNNRYRWNGTEFTKINVPNKFVYVSAKSDLPSPASNVITLENNYTYYFTNDVDLGGDRLVSGVDTVILGSSSENAKITSTGLGVGVALLTSTNTTVVKDVTITDVDTAFDFDGAGNDMELNWTGVNIENVPNIGTFNNVGNFIFTKGAILNSQGLVFSGTQGTISFNESFFMGDGTVGDIIEVDALANISRRFRIIYSSFVADTSTNAINVNALATIPVESYILDTVNFSGSGTFLAGLDEADNEALFTNCVGIQNTGVNGQIYMNDNATATTIADTTTFVKVAGTTTASADNSKYSMPVNNRLENDAVIERKFLIQCTLSFTSGNNNECEFGFYDSKLADIRTPSKTKATANSSGKAENINLACVVSHADGNYLEVHCRNKTATTDITVTDLNFLITEI